MNAGFFRRIGAYLIDFFVIIFLSNILTSVMPNRDKILNLSSQTTNLMSEYYEVVISGNEEEIEIFTNKINDISYEISKSSIYVNMASIILYFLYFVVLPTYCNGQTLGKKILKIETVDLENNAPSFIRMLIRGIILYPIAFNVLDLICLFIFKQSIYQNISSFLVFAQYGLFIACFISIIVSGRGIHDRLAGTSVIVAGTGEGEVESKVSKWKKNSEKEKEVKKYRVNHTTGKSKNNLREK